MTRDLAAALVIFALFSVAVVLPQVVFASWGAPHSPLGFIAVMLIYYVLLILIVLFLLKKGIKDKEILHGCIIVTWIFPWKFLSSLYNAIFVNSLSMATYALTAATLISATFLFAYLIIWRVQKR